MNFFTKIKQFFSEIITELKKTTWPTKKALQHATCIVIITMFLLGSYVSIVDFVLFNSIKFINFLAR